MAPRAHGLPARLGNRRRVARLGKLKKEDKQEGNRE